jgi:hypothetical protein
MAQRGRPKKSFAEPGINTKIPGVSIKPITNEENVGAKKPWETEPKVTWESMKFIRDSSEYVKIYKVRDWGKEVGIKRELAYQGKKVKGGYKKIGGYLPNDKITELTGIKING